MKIAILGDTHWGARKDSPVFYKHYEAFYDGFFQHLEDEGINTVIQVGDTFEARQRTNSLTLQEARRIYFDRAEAKGIYTYITVGNHDIYHRESVTVNTPRLLLSDYECVKVVDKPTTVVLPSCGIGVADKQLDLIPWICEENQVQIVEFIQKSESQYCAGHFEIAGFAMYRGMEANDGLTMDLFSRYDHTWSGHYHSRSTKENITYVGTPYEMTWQDYGDPKGFHVFDTETGKLTFIQNMNPIFIRLIYDEDARSIVAPEGLTDRFVRVVVTNCTNRLALEAYLQSIREQKPYDLKVDEEGFSVTGIEDEDGVVIENTMVVTEKYIDASDTDVDKTALKKFMHELYIEAMNAEEA